MDVPSCVRVRVPSCVRVHYVRELVCVCVRVVRKPPCVRVRVVHVPSCVRVRAVPSQGMPSRTGQTATIVITENSPEFAESFREGLASPA